MRYRILGPLEVQDGPRTVPLPQGRQRVLLAVLLLHANETLSSDRLIDALWGEAPPASAGSSMHNLVSGLRKALGDGRLVTRGHGYALLVGDGELDARQFDAAVRDGRAALTAGEPERAAARLREGLELWRGAALGDLAYHAAITGEAERLEEARLAALEDRIEADLACGRHADVVAELDGLVARHPLRERLRGQQMVALFRCGRQADALAAYRDARERLVEELGVEPGPALRRVERAVLEQDPALGAPDALPSAPPAVAWARRHAGALLAAGALLLAAAVVALVARDDEEPSIRAATAGARDFVAVIDPATGRISERLPVGKTPTAVAVGAGAAWTINADGQDISRVDLRTRAVKTYSTGAVPLDIAADESAAWLVSSNEDPRAGNEALPPPETLSQLDPASGTPVNDLTLRPSTGLPFRGPPQIVAVGGGAIWAIGRSGWLHRLDPGSGRSATFRERSVVSVASGGGQLWVLAEPAQDDPAVRLLRLDPRSGRVLERVRVPSRSPGQLAIGAGAVWLTDPFAGGVWRIDVGADAPRPRIIAVDQGVDGVAAGADAVWTSNTQTGTVARIDPATGRVAARIAVGGAPRSIALGAERLWVTVAGGSGPSLAGALDSGSDVKPVDSRNCGPVLAGPGGDPDLLIVSDVPLEGSWRPASEAMNAAVAFVLRARRFRAGRFTLAMQPCNDALAQTGYPDEPKCRANATAYARNPAVIGVVGPVHSACSATMLPIMNRTPSGPVSIVSTLNSFVDLVRPESASIQRELFPTGQRGYARVFPTDDFEAAAGALFAKRLAPEGVFFAQDQFDPFWLRYFRGAARRIRLPILEAATVEIDPAGRGTAKRGRALAERISASGARVVYLHGLAEMLPALRARLGRDVALVFSGRTQPVAALFGAGGPDARGAYVMIAGLPRERLGPTGRRFVRDFGATRPGGQVPTLALYAATATEVLLDAIARSDGTRESVSRELAAVRLPESPLGPIALDGNGEPDRQPIAVVRADHGGAPHDPGGTQGGTVVEVIEPDARLVGKPGSE